MLITLRQHYIWMKYCLQFFLLIDSIRFEIVLLVFATLYLSMTVIVSQLVLCRIEIDSVEEL